ASVGAPAGTMIQAARGLASLVTKSSSDAAPVAPPGGDLLHRLRAAVVDDAAVPGAAEALDHVGAHAAQSDHAQWHARRPFVNGPATLRFIGPAACSEATNRATIPGPGIP